MFDLRSSLRWLRRLRYFRLYRRIVRGVEYIAPIFRAQYYARQATGRSRRQAVLSLLLMPPDLLLGLLFDSVYRGDVLLRNIGFSTNSTALRPKRSHSSSLKIVVVSNILFFSFILQYHCCYCVYAFASVVDIYRNTESFSYRPLHQKGSVWYESNGWLSVWKSAFSVLW
jgi:hypothetical protein